MRSADRTGAGRSFLQWAWVGALAFGVLGINVGAWADDEQDPAAAPAIPLPASAPATAPAGGTPKFRCDELTYNFPDVWGGDVVEHTWVIHNDGDGTLQLLEVKPHCGCTVAKYDETIAPGGTGKIAAKLTTNRGLATELAKDIDVRTNDPKNAKLVLALKGKVKTRITMEPPTGAQFGQGIPADPVRRVKLTNNTEKPMKIEHGPALGPNAFSYEVNEVQAGKVYEVVVTVDKNKIKEGPNYAQIGLPTGMTEEPNFTLTANLYLAPPVQVIPATLSVPTPVTEAFHREITLTYSGPGPMKVTGVSVNDPSIKVQAQEVQLPATPQPKTQPGPRTQPAPIGQPAQGQLWKLVVDIPADWEPPTAAAANQPTTDTRPVPATQPAAIEITALTDVKDKPQIKVRVFGFPKPVTAEMLIGKPAPVDTLKDINGKDIQLGAKTGRVTVTALWASWCPHCKRALPLLQKLAAAYADKGVDFNLVSEDDKVKPEQIAKVMSAIGVTLPYALDPAQKVGKKYHASSFPTVFVTGKDGIVEAVNKGAGGKFESTLTTQLDLLLAGKTRKDFPKPATKPATTDNTPVTATRPANLAGGPTLVVEPQQQDIGQFKPGAAGKFNLFVRNGGAQVLNIAATEPSEGLTIDPDYIKSVQPNTPSVLRLAFNAPSQPGPFHHKLTIESNDPNRPKVVVGLNGAVLRPIEFEPAAGIDFGRRPNTFAADRMVTIKWNGQGELKLLGAESSSPKFEPLLKLGQAGPTYLMVVKAKPPFDLGETTATITVKTDCKEQPTLTVPIRLFQPARIDVVPTQITLSKPLRIRQAAVAIMNNGTNPLNILGVKTSNPKIRTQFYPDPDGMSYRMQLSLLPDFSPADDGEKITVRTDDAEYGEIVIPIKISNVPGPSVNASRQK